MKGRAWMTGKGCRWERKDEAGRRELGAIQEGRKRRKEAKRK